MVNYCFNGLSFVLWHIVSCLHGMTWDDRQHLKYITHCVISYGTSPQWYLELTIGTLALSLVLLYQFTESNHEICHNNRQKFEKIYFCFINLSQLTIRMNTNLGGHLGGHVFSKCLLIAKFKLLLILLSYHWIVINSLITKLTCTSFLYLV